MTDKRESIVWLNWNKDVTLESPISSSSCNAESDRFKSTRNGTRSNRRYVIHSIKRMKLLTATALQAAHLSSTALDGANIPMAMSRKRNRYTIDIDVDREIFIFYPSICWWLITFTGLDWIPPKINNGVLPIRIIMFTICTHLSLYSFSFLQKKILCSFFLVNPSIRHS